MNKPWKIILVFIGVFVSGAVVGGVLSLRLFTKRPSRPNFEQFTHNRAVHLSKVLGCTPQQTDKIQAIMTKSGQELRKLRQTSFREAIDIFDRMDSEISSILTPEQQAKFEQMHKALKERLRGAELGGWRPGVPFHRPPDAPPKPKDSKSSPPPTVSSPPTSTQS